MTRWDQATSAERSARSKLLAAVMRASAAGADEDAVYLWNILGHAFGADAVIESLIFFADRAASTAVDSPTGWVGIEFVDEHGAPCDIEELPYPVRWSARMVAAAANRDHDTMHALIGAAADDGQLNSCVPVLSGMADAAFPPEEPNTTATTDIPGAGDFQRVYLLVTQGGT